MKKLKNWKCSAKDLARDQKIFEKLDFYGVINEDENPLDKCITLERDTSNANFPEEYLAPDTKVLNQGSVGSCCAHALATALVEGEHMATKHHGRRSVGYIYGNRKSTDHQGEGLIIRQGLAQLKAYGDPDYDDFPYNLKYPEVKKLIEADRERLDLLASENKILNYFSFSTEAQIKQAVMKYGGVIINVPVYSDFSRDLEITETGVFKAWHAMVIIGWNADDQWIVQNSWGPAWGYYGRLKMRMNYPVREFWALEVAEFASEAVKKTFFQRIIKNIKYFFLDIFNWFRNLFR